MTDKGRENLFDSVEHRDVEVGLTALARGDTADKLSAVLNRLLTVEGALEASISEEFKTSRIEGAFMGLIRPASRGGLIGSRRQVSRGVFMESKCQVSRDIRGVIRIALKCSSATSEHVLQILHKITWRQCPWDSEGQSSPKAHLNVGIPSDIHHFIRY